MNTSHGRESQTDMDVPAGVLVVPPGRNGGTWRVLEVESDMLSPLLPDEPAGTSPLGDYDSPARALDAAFDVLTLLVEGRIPAMHERIQESVRDFVRTLEAHGYDREAAVKLLLDMADRNASSPPKSAPGQRQRRQ